jgi:Actinobacteria/chloroflexi VLRF1 release factor
LVAASKKYYLNRTRMLDFLAKLSGAKDGQFHTLYLPPRTSPDPDKIPGLSGNISAEAGKIAAGSETGSMFFLGDHQKYVIIPPFPVAEKSTADYLNIEPMKMLLSKDYIIGVVLVRLGSYAIGVCRGEKLINSKVGTGLVHGRHRQGGSSAHRFERHRDKQIESFLIRVCGHAREQLEPYVKSIDYMVYGGARTTILLAQKYCPFLEKLGKPILPPLLDTPEPRRPVLETAIGRIWSSEIYEWTDN